MMRRDRAHLQFILDGEAGEDAVRLAQAAAEGGADSIQIRGKGLGAEELLERTLAVIEALRGSRRPVPVLVNDRLDVALLAGADGVHLPEASFSPTRASECRRLAASAPSRAGGGERPSFVIGRSVHSSTAVVAPGTSRLDYLLFGHVFATASKPGLPPRGLESLARVAHRSPVPVLAVGGITPENAASALKAGAAGVAVISTIRDALDPYAATLALRRALDRGATG